MESFHSIQEQASNLVADLASGLTKEWCPSSMSVNVYDTAWVSMIAKESHGEKHWLFPKAFHFIWDSQHVNGCWDEDGPDTNAILCTMAALLACLEHRKNIHYSGYHPPPREFSVRISKAVIWLEGKFSEWKGDGGVDSVAWEMLVPAHLRLLAEYGISFTSPALENMIALSEHRLSKLKVDALYTSQQATIFHSLEALIGRIDFDRLRGCKVRGSMLGSPSSTAAYLIHACNWDEEAEMYLKHVFDHGQGKGNGSFPSAAPIDVFEISWVLSTFLEEGFSVEALGRKNTSLLSSHLAQRLRAFSGVVGFSSMMLPDADDTAKCLQALAFFDEHQTSADSMIRLFWSPSSFKTYEKESTRSISANCNILKALLVMKTVDGFAPQVLTAASFICDAWMSSTPHDKWNTAWQYCAMLSAQGLTRLLKRAESEPADFLPFELKHHKIPVVISRIACQFLHSQAADGSFGDGCDEITAYAILALVALVSPHAGLFLVREEISTAIRMASSFLQAQMGQWKPRRIWIEKVTYSSEVLTRAYCLAAMHQSFRHEQSPYPTTPDMQETKLCRLFRSLPLFTQSKSKKMIIRLGLQEGQPYLAQLEHNRFDIFPKPPKVNEKYLRIIPFAWTACNYLTGSLLPPVVLMDMMEISLLNYQADEYIEMKIPQCQAHELSVIRDALNEYLVEPLQEASGPALRPSKRQRVINDNSTPNEQVGSILETLFKYMDRVLNRPHVCRALPTLKQQVREELVGYLQAQIRSVGAKSRLGQSDAYSSFFEWVHTFGARDTSCPFSFAYFLCLVNQTAEAPVHNSMTNGHVDIKQQQSISFEIDYLLRDLCGSLSRICRMYNDYGSIRRDHEEGNLNSVDFFFQYQNGASNGDQSLLENEAKAAIWSIASLEREHLNRASERLRDCVTPKLHNAIQVFVNVTDLFGQIYVAKDIGTRTKVIS